MRRAALLTAACLAAAGCGGGGSSAETTAKPAGESAAIKLPPTPTPQPLAYAPGAKDALTNGAVAVVDVANRVGIEPRMLDVNREQRLSALRWTGWGSPRTIGHGDLRTLVCDPSCARGTLEQSRGVIVLSAPKRCGDERFYTKSNMTYEEQGTGKTRAPATYLRTPPC